MESLSHWLSGIIADHEDLWGWNYVANVCFIDILLRVVKLDLWLVASFVCIINYFFIFLSFIFKRFNNPLSSDMTNKTS